MKYILILILFASCSPQKRMQRLLKKHPNLITTVDKDTTIRDTITEIDTFISEIHSDSFIIKTDTIIKTNKLTIERFKDKFKVIVQPDTFIVLDTIYYINTVKVKGEVLTVFKTPKWFWWLVGFIALLGIFFYLKIR